MSVDEKEQGSNASVKEKISTKQRQDKESHLLGDYVSKNTVVAYNDLKPLVNMRERTKEFPNDSNDYKARLHDIAWSSQNDIAFVGQANDLVISDGATGYWKNIIKLPSMALSVTFSPNGNLVSTACLDATNSCRIYNVGIETIVNGDDSKNNEIEEILTKSQRSIDHSEGMVISHPFLSNNEILTATKNIIYLYNIDKSHAIEIFDNTNNNGHSEKAEISCVAVMNRNNTNNNNNYSNNENDNNNNNNNSDNNNNNNSSSNDSGKLFLSGDDTGCVKLWDIRDSSNKKNKCVMTWYKQGYFETEVSCIEFFPNNECFFAASKDGSMRLFDIRQNYKQLMSYQSWYQHKKNKNIPIISLKLSKSGRFVFVAYDDTEEDDLNWNLVECIEIVSGKSCQQFRHPSVVPALALSPDGHSIVTACWDGKIRKFSSN